MNTRQNVKSGSSIAEQLSSVDMSLEMRTAALRDAFIAELIVDAIEWVCRKFGEFNRARADAFLKHNVYYWE